MALFECFECKGPQKFSHGKFHWVESAKIEPTESFPVYGISSTGHVVISSKAGACTSQPVAFSGHLSTRGCLTSLRNKPQQKQTHQHFAVVNW